MSLRYNDTPLHKASANGHKAVVEVLLKAGAITNSVNKFIQSRISFMYCKNMYEYQAMYIIIITCMYIYLRLEYQLHNLLSIIITIICRVVILLYIRVLFKVIIQL